MFDDEAWIECLHRAFFDVSPRVADETRVPEPVIRPRMHVAMDPEIRLMRIDQLMQIVCK